MDGRTKSDNDLFYFHQLNDSRLLDLGFRGPRITWFNCHHDSATIFERFDWCVANESWHNLFSKCLVNHLNFLQSDHCLMNLSLYQSHLLATCPHNSILCFG